MEKNLQNINEPDDNEDEVIETDPSGRYVRYSHLLGSGTFKKVYRAMDTELGIEVAWNQILIDCNTFELDKNRTLKEIEFFQKIRHQNIIEFYHYWIDESKNQIVFISELMLSGTLKTYIEKSPEVKLKILKIWSKQILQGLHKLHSQEPPIIHKDIKCDNIFINGTTEGEVKIGDLGFGIFCREKGSSHPLIGSPEYMAPEWLCENLSTKIDIWSFGLTLLEMITQIKPYSECDNISQIYKKLSEETLPVELSWILDSEVKSFVQLCLANVNKRPTAEQLLQHPFFQLDGENSNLPVSISKPDSSENNNKNGSTNPNVTLNPSTSGNNHLIMNGNSNSLRIGSNSLINGIGPTSSSATGNGSGSSLIPATSSRSNPLGSNPLIPAASSRSNPLTITLPSSSLSLSNQSLISQSNVDNIINSIPLAQLNSLFHPASSHSAPSTPVFTSPAVPSLSSHSTEKSNQSCSLPSTPSVLPSSLPLFNSLNQQNYDHQSSTDPISIPHPLSEGTTLFSVSENENTSIIQENNQLENHQSGSSSPQQPGLPPNGTTGWNSDSPGQENKSNHHNSLLTVNGEGEESNKEGEGAIINRMAVNHTITDPEVIVDSFTDSSNIPMKLKIEKNGEHFKIEFRFDLANDTAADVAREMVQELSLGNDSFENVRLAIQKQVDWVTFRLKEELILEANINDESLLSENELSEKGEGKRSDDDMNFLGRGSDYDLELLVDDDDDDMHFTLPPPISHDTSDLEDLLDSNFSLYDLEDQDDLLSLDSETDVDTHFTSPALQKELEEFEKILKRHQQEIAILRQNQEREIRKFRARANRH